MSPDLSSTIHLSSPIEENPPSSSSSTTDSQEINQTLKTGLREILPNLDDQAISQIWADCKTRAPDCTVDEVLYFAREKADAVKNARSSPAGLLIRSVPKCFEGTLLSSYRNERRREQEREQKKREQAELDAAAMKEFEWRRELDREQAEQELQQIAPEESERLKKQTVAKILREYPDARQRWKDFDEHVHKYLLTARVDNVRLRYLSAEKQLYQETPNAKYWIFLARDGEIRKRMKANPP